MSAFDFFVDLANLIGVGLTLVTLVEVVRTKRWAKRKLLRTNERWRCVRLADRIIATRRMIRQMIDEPVRLKMDSWRTEFRETISEMSDDRSLSVGDKAMIKRAIRGLHVPVKDVNHEVERLRDLLISLAALEGRVSARIAPEDEE